MYDPVQPTTAQRPRNAATPTVGAMRPHLHHPARLSTLALTVASALAACGQPPAAPKIPGATVSVQLSDNTEKTSWTLGKVSLDIQPLVGAKDKVIATGETDAAGLATVQLPGESEGALTDATSPVSAMFGSNSDDKPACKPTFSSSDPDATVLVAAPRSFTGTDGGGLLTPSTPVDVKKNAYAFQLLVLSTRGITITGEFKCNQKPYFDKMRLEAGWNIVELKFDLAGISYSVLPLNSLLYAIRSDT